MNDTYKLPSNVRTFAIISGENPMGRVVTAEEGLQLTGNLAEGLRKMHFCFFQIEGSYAGRIGWYFLVLNIGLDDAKFLAHEFDQSAFVLAKVLENGKVISICYEKKFSAREMAVRGWKRPYPAKADYRSMARSNVRLVPDSKDAGQYSAITGRFKYRIPLSCFTDFAETLDRRCAMSEEFRECLDDKIQRGIDGNGARNRMHNRASIYGFISRFQDSLPGVEVWEQLELEEAKR